MTITTEPLPYRPRTFKTTLARARFERGLSQDEVALAADIDQAELSRYERGVRKPKDKTLKRLAAVLGLDFVDLLDTLEAT